MADYSVAQFEAMRLEIAGLKRENDEQRSEIERLKAQIHACPTCGETCVECRCMQTKLAECRLLLREAARCDPNVYWLSVQWHVAAAQAAGGGKA